MSGAGRHVFIAGASRGIGLKLAGHYAADGWAVWGIGRSPEPEETCPGFTYVSVGAADFDPDRLPGLAQAPLTRLVLNAAVFGPNPPDNLDLAPDAFAQLLNNNVVAQYRVFKRLLPLLSKAGDAKIAFIISKAGMHTRLTERKAIGYRVSKSAQIALALALVEACRAQSIAVCLINPGWVRTRIGGKNAPTAPETSAAGIKAVLEALPMSRTGTAYNFDGSELRLTGGAGR